MVRRAVRGAACQRGRQGPVTLLQRVVLSGRVNGVVVDGVGLVCDPAVNRTSYARRAAARNPNRSRAPVGEVLPMAHATRECCPRAAPCAVGSAVGSRVSDLSLCIMCPAYANCMQ